MPEPRVDRQGEKLYLIDSLGARWRVHDARFTAGKPHRVPFSDSRANTRYFVSETGERRAYTFARGDRRDVEISTLSEHFRNAGFLGTLPPFDGTARGPH